MAPVSFNSVSMKQLIRGVLPTTIDDALTEWWHRKLIKSYIRGGRIPWSPGYEVYKRRLFKQVLGDRVLLERFRRGESLGDGYGIGVEERCVEYPWLLAKLLDGAGVILDAGSALNHEFFLESPYFRWKSMYIGTLAPEASCFWHKGISYLFHDLRDIPFRDAYFDTIACVSTLEHVGFDNTYYTKDESHRENRPEDFVLVVQELRRVLKSGGTLLLTVPFGVYHKLSTFQQFDRKLLSTAIEAFGEASEVAETFYRYTSAGWNVANAEDCSDCEYVPWGMLSSAERSEQFPIQADAAAAARAVACISLVKA